MSAGLNSTPSANRVHIAFFGLRNAGKSTLVNEFCGQHLAIVSPTPGTTTDPVSKAMEILPLGPCLVTDTAGLDDEGDLGKQRVEKTMKVLETTDIAVWVEGEGEGVGERCRCRKKEFLAECRTKGIAVLEYRRGDSVAALREKIAALKLEEKMPGLLEGLVEKGDRVICVCPIDESAPKGRLILPQQQVIRECLDRHVPCTVVQPEELASTLAAQAGEAEGRGRRPRRPVLVITDSQAFVPVQKIIAETPRSTSTSTSTSTPTSSLQPAALTSFSILFARQKGDLDEFNRGLEAVRKLKDGDTVLVAEACTHHRQCNDIGTTKIPKAVTKLSGGKKLNFVFVSGNDFTEPRTSNLQPPTSNLQPIALVVHCGGCMLTRRAMLARIARCREASLPIVNYGILLQAAANEK